MAKRVTKSTKRKKKTTKATVKKLATKLPTLIPQPNGRGALLSGGIPGHKGGSGRPPDIVRKRCRESFDKLIPILERIATDKLPKTSEKPRVRDRIMAIDTLGKHGFGGDTKIVAAQAESPDGYTFTLVLGERGQP